MATVNLGLIFGGGKDLIPHIEEAALFYITRAYVMQQRVTLFNDMEGFNPRKVSEYLLPGTAKELSEATDIPESVIYRARRSQIDIKEIGDKYFLTDRRVQTDLEDIVAHTALTLGKSLGDKMEMDLVAEALATFQGGTVGTAGTDYSVNLPISLQYEFQKRNGATSRGTLFHVIHPFQAIPLMQDLVQFHGSDAGANLDFRNSAIRSWKVPGFMGLDIAQSEFIPRNILARVKIDGTGGTFRLSVKNLTTGAITVSATPATTATNIKSALDALAIGTWTVADGGGGNIDIDVTPPTTLYLNADEELRVAVDVATPTLEGQKSAYDLVTTPAGANGYDQAGVAYGVKVEERSASAKALMFYRPALALDMRQSPTGYFDLVNDGRTAAYSLYAKYGVGDWMPHLGAFVHTKATSPLAVA